MERDKFYITEKLQFVLCCIFDLAADDYKFSSPMTKVVLPKHQSKKGNTIIYEEEKQLIEYCIEHREFSASYALLVHLYRDMRRSGLKAMRFRNEQWMECDTSKEKKGRNIVARKIPITPMMRKVLPYIDFEKAKTTNVNTINIMIKRIFLHHHTHEL